MKVIIYPQENGELAIVYPIDRNNLEENVSKFVPEKTPYSILDNLNIDSYFRSAYEYKNGEVFLNLEKAKDVQKNKWREARKKRFEKLDLQFMLALEKGDSELQKLISNKKQELRDVTNTFLSDDLEEIKITYPNILLEE